MNDIVTSPGVLLPDQRETFRDLLLEEGGSFNVFPLSFAQERLWFLEQLEPGSPLYHIPAAIRVRGVLRPSLLRQALARIVERHESLRTVFLAVDGQPVQVVAPELEVPLEIADLSNCPDPEAEALRRAREEARRPFDLERGPLLRVTLLALRPDDALLLLTLHHIVSDGWSNGILVREVTAAYEALLTGADAALPELPIQYADYAVWQRQWLEGEVLEEQLGYWRRQLAGVAPLELPTDRPRPARRRLRGGQQAFTLDRETAAGLEALARQEGATLFAVVLGVFAVLLHRYSGQTDVAVGSPVANRNRGEIEGLIGFFVNTLVLRSDLGGDPTFRQLLGRLRETLVDAYAHQDLPFERLVEELEPERSLSRTPLFQVMLVLQNAPQAELRLPGATLTPLPLDSGAAKFDLTLRLAEQAGELAAVLEYDADLFTAETAGRMARHFRTLAGEVARDAGRRVSDLPLLAAGEEAEALAGSRGEPAPWEPRCVHELFAEQAARTPQAPAVACEGLSLTYAELEARTNRLARHLQKMGVVPEDRVGLCLDRSLDALVALLGIVKAGGAYVPLDPGLPAERLAFQIDDAAARVLVTRTPLAARLPRHRARAVLLDEEAATIAGESDGPLPPAAAPHNLVYVIYTSGSTGRPKGVALEHRQLHHYVAAVLRRLEMPPGSSWATVSTLAADLGNTSIYAALCGGGCLHVVAEERVADAAALAELFERQPVDVLKIVPSHLAALLGGERPERVLPRRGLVLGGEAASWALVDRVRELAPGCAVFNHYGPTETAVGVAAGRLDPGAERAAAVPPLGRPLDRTALYLLDARLRPVPAGVPGRLHVGGPGLARGYLGRPDLTAERFLPDPFAGTPGARLYDTGDRVRRLADGSLEFLGRVDHQLKIRGFRVELGEIEAALEAHPRVRRAAVEPDGPGLAAWVAAPETDAPSPAELRTFLAERLPEYMVPRSFARLDALPLTPNGKVDRRALPRPERHEGKGEAPADRGLWTPVQELLAGIWADVLGSAPPSLHSGFFESGGHSLLATQLVARLRQAFGVELPVRRLFEAPTVAGLAEAIASAGRPEHGPALERVPRQGLLPVGFAQERLWFLHQVDPASPAYNLPYFARLEGRLDVPALAAALAELVRRHEVLRTAFPSEAGRPAQRILDRVEIPLPVVDLGGLPQSADEAARQARDEARRPFDLGRAPLLRVTLVRVGAEEHLLLLSLHHIVSDAWSRGVLAGELAALYGAFREGRSSPLPALPVQYADFAVWQRRWLQGETLERQLAYWKDRLAGVTPLDLPADHPRPAVLSHRGALVRAPLGQALTAELETVARRHDATLFMTLLAAFQALLHRYTGETDLTVGTPIAGRDRAETELLAGFFVNTLVLRGDLAGDPTGAELLRRVRETALEAYTHQHLPFEKLVEELQPERDLSRTPLFQVMLMLQNVRAGTAGFPGLTVTPLEGDGGTAKFDLTLVFEETAAGLAGVLEYSTDLFAEATAVRLLAHFRNVATALALDPGRRLSELSPLGVEERRQILHGWNETVLDYPREACIHELIERQARATPGATAVRFGGAALTYEELDRRANRLARHLRRLGVGPEVRVGIQLERSADMVMALLAVLKAGGAYVPLDPTYPRERLDWVRQDAGIAVILTRGDLDAWSEALAQESGEPLASGVQADDLAYLIYTSGSTGRPKGVMVTHRNAVNFFAGMDGRIGDDRPGVWLAVTSISFDISVLELLWTLARGFEVVVQGDLPRVEVVAGPAPEPVAATAGREIEFSLFYFASDDHGGPDPYRLLLEGARFADRNGFTAVWTPERHFHAFGGLYPNPSVVGAAIAAVTERIQIRAGSVVLPLQDPLRVAEEWSVVDNLSRGRAGVSFASGWHADDFVLAPGNFRDRKDVMIRGIETVRRLWRGEPVTLPGGLGQPVEVRIHPRPVQAELPVWVTAAGNPDTFRLAGELRAGMLTHLLGQDIDELAEKIAVYRQGWRDSGAEGEGRVTLMLHTYVGRDLEEVRETVRHPFYNYLRSSLGLWRNLARSLGRDIERDTLTPDEEEALLARAFDRYFEVSGLMGTPETCLRQLDRLRAAGVDEVGCLVDFGVAPEAALAGLDLLRELRDRDRQRLQRAAAPAADDSLAVQIRRHGVSHLQCTPSMARMLAMDPDVLGSLGSLRKLMLGGEALSGALVEQLRGTVAGEIHNMYGPTETTVWSATHRVETAADPVPVGRPIANTEIYLVDGYGEPVPAGVPGELLIGGEGVVRGYLGRPELTAERFVPAPFGSRPGGRLYRTGDRARWRPDGTVEFLGRADHQVKIRGYRIEPGEVETALRQHPDVEEAVVVAREDRPGDRRLVAYLVPDRSRLPLRHAVTPEEAERLFAGRQRYHLPNGMEVAVLNDFQASLAYHEIFHTRNYLRHGIELRDGDVVFDVGGNVGFFTLFASQQRQRNVKIYTFEPIPPTFETLRTNVELFGLPAEVHNFGLSSQAEEVEFTFYPNMSGLSGRYSEAAYDIKATREIMLGGLRDFASEDLRRTLGGQDLDELLASQFESERHLCRLRTLSEVVREKGVERIDLLKIDVERAEIDVLRGIADADWPKIRQVVMEVDGRDNLDQVVAILEGQGFDVAWDLAFDSERDEHGPEVVIAYLYASRGGVVKDDPIQFRVPRAAAGESGLSVAALREFLGERLPDYMVPAAFVLLDALPLTPNGKIDRKALPAPEGERPRLEVAYEAPETDVQKAIAQVWSDVLRLDQVGLHDNFFELGGGSLTLVETRARLREALGHDFSLVDMFRAPTVASLALLVNRPREVEETAAPPSTPSYGNARQRAQRRREAMRRHGGETPEERP